MCRATILYETTILYDFKESAFRHACTELQQLFSFVYRGELKGKNTILKYEWLYQGKTTLSKADNNLNYLIFFINAVDKVFGYHCFECTWSLLPFTQKTECLEI